MNNNLRKIVEEFDFNKVNVSSSILDSLNKSIIDGIHAKMVYDDRPVLTYNEYLLWDLNLKSEHPYQYIVMNDDELETIIDNMYIRIMVDVSYDVNKKLYGLWYLPMNLNWLDISNVTNLNLSFADMDDNFTSKEGKIIDGSRTRTIDISKWNTYNVKSMAQLFNSCQMCKNTDISNWDVHNCMDFSNMLRYSNFSQENINKIKSKWKINPLANGIPTMYDLCRDEVEKYRKY